MEIIFSDSFKEEFRKIKDKPTRIKIIKHIQKLQILPESGKPLKYELKNHRTIRIPPFRLVYRLEMQAIVIVCFDHRKDVYEN